MKKSEFNTLCDRLSKYAVDHNLYQSVSLNGKNWCSLYIAPNLDSDSDSDRDLSVSLSSIGLAIEHPLSYTLNGHKREFTTIDEIFSTLKGF